MRVVVTGSEGNIGHELTRFLSDKGFDVTGIDPSKKYPPLRNTLSMTIDGISDCLDIFKSAQIVFHLAGRAEVLRSVQDPMEDLGFNLTPTVSLLEALRKADGPRLVYASSSSVYGENTPNATEDLPPSPQSPYAIHKLASEIYCRIYHRLYGIKVVILRLFSVYGGERESVSKLLPMFIRRALTNDDLIIYGDGTQVRDLVEVSDVCRGFLIAGLKGKEGEIYNVGTGRRTSIRQLAELVTMMAGSKSRIVHAAPRRLEPKGNIANVSKAKQHLGLEAEISIEEGIIRELRKWRTRNTNGCAD